ncbi:putative enzyme [Rubrivivax sp. A210]|uniref:ABC transporter ATP-binding protein n=1 Tax=Rubrivivax sp. A210 TaxID=2772301 RepID=UPI0019190853|nr:ABC transporter ATP-binding protein [Rubrivivax sp. A210]CAD5372621.1 putative enzyme [Rubrivivax sp. A210]
MSTAATPRGFATGLHAFLRDLLASVGAGRMARALLLLLLGTLSEGLGLLMLVPLLQLIDGQAATPALQWLLRQGLRPELGPMLGLFAALMLMRAALARQRDMALLALRLDYLEALRARLEAALALASWPFLVRLRHADVMHLMFDQMARVTQGSFYLMQGLSGLGLGIASLAVVLLVAPPWILVLVLPFVLLLWLLRRRLARAAALGTRFGLGQREFMAGARDFLAGLKLVKAHGIEARHLVELGRRADALRDLQFGFARHQANTRAWFEGGSALVLAALLYGASRWGGMALPELILLVFVFTRLLPLLRDAQLQLQQLAHMLPAYDEINDWIGRCHAAAEPPGAAQTPPMALRHRLTLEGVSLRYRDAATPALAHADLELLAGTVTVLTGTSGSGKTTLADIALGLLAPDGGRVHVDGMVLAGEAIRRRWRASVAYVAQDTYLFPASIRDNLCWLSGPRTDAELWAALELADAAPFVRALADGLGHPLGERGEGLSGGQRQRLALARALLCRPQLLVLDEATSQLDPASEERVLQGLATLRGGMTLLAIAHRPAASRHADRIVQLEGGRIVADSAAAPVA